ncbi:MAG: acetoin dehydrogenase dihydrolipoyllysine-residue acetyltransferase subunit [Hyphomicrobiales bacterium]|nr:acetoin dehydrogenase dihydrolipoyllysine-residue acetyltransferase subunit [Hyphomicrobiales bacterium]
MAVEVILPRVDMDMETGKVSRWHAAEGEAVAKGQLLFEIETAKAAMDIEAPASGTLRGVAAREGDELPVGAIVGWICNDGEAPPARAAAAPVGSAVAAPAGPVKVLGDSTPTSLPAARGATATPKARRLAREAGLDVASLAGSGPQGRVQALDVERARGVGAAKSGAPRAHGEWLRRGAGPPFVFLHGFGAELGVWKPLVQRLDPSRGALALDMPGHGLSPPPPDDVTLDALVAAVEAALAAEGVARFHLVGHSLGGAVAAMLAARLGERVFSLTLVAPAGLGPEIDGAFMDGFLRATSVASLRPWLRRLARDPETLGAGLAEATLKRRAERGLGPGQARIAAALMPDGVQAIDVRPALAAFGGPARVVFGAEDAIIPPRHAVGLPGAVAVHVLAGVGHNPQLEARAEMARILSDQAAAGDARVR